MNIDLIIEFNVLAETLNFTEAARRLYLSQPTLSKHVSALEQELNLKLIERQPVVKLTYAGREFHRKTAALLDGVVARIEETVEEVRESAANTKVLRMPDYTKLIPGYFALANELRSTFDRLYRPLSLRIEYVPVAEWRELSLEECLEEGIVDIAFALEDPAVRPEDVERAFDTRGLCASLVAECPISLVIRADHPLNCQASISVGDLDGLSFFSHGKSHIERSMERTLVEMLARQGVAVAPKRPFYGTDAVDVWGYVEMRNEVLLCPAASLVESGFADQHVLVERAMGEEPLVLNCFGVARKEAPRFIADIMGLLRR